MQAFAPKADVSARYPLCFALALSCTPQYKRARVVLSAGWRLICSFQRVSECKYATPRAAVSLSKGQSQSHRSREHIKMGLTLLFAASAAPTHSLEKVRAHTSVQYKTFCYSCFFLLFSSRRFNIGFSLVLNSCVLIC